MDFPADREHSTIARAADNILGVPKFPAGFGAGAFFLLLDVRPPRSNILTGKYIAARRGGEGVARTPGRGMEADGRRPREAPGERGGAVFGQGVRRDHGPGDRGARGRDQARPVLLLPQQGRDLPRPHAGAPGRVRRARSNRRPREKGPSRERITRLCLRAYDDFVRNLPHRPDHVLRSITALPQGAPYIDFDAVQLRFQEIVIRRLLKEGIRERGVPRGGSGGHDVGRRRAR